jgi:uncharacterized protein
MVTEAQIAQIAAVLEPLGGLDALWIFGSEATGAIGPESDVDLGALFARRPSSDGLGAARAAIEDIVGRAVDLVDLEETSPILAMQVLRHGILVRENNEAHRVRFAAELGGRYEDVVLLRRRVQGYLRERLAHGRA